MINTKSLTLILSLSLTFAAPKRQVHSLKTISDEFERQILADYLLSNQRTNTHDKRVGRDLAEDENISPVHVNSRQRLNRRRRNRVAQDVDNSEIILAELQNTKKKQRQTRTFAVDSKGMLKFCWVKDLDCIRKLKSMKKRR